MPVMTTLEGWLVHWPECPAQMLLSGPSVLPFVLAALADGTKNGSTTIMVIELVQLGAVESGVAWRLPFGIAIVA